MTKKVIINIHDVPVIENIDGLFKIIKDNAESELLCYICKEPVALKELHEVDQIVESLDLDKHTWVVDSFTDIYSLDNETHESIDPKLGEGIINLCKRCLNEFMYDADHLDEANSK